VKNFIYSGRTITVAAPTGGVSSGDGVLIGDLFGIAQHDAAEGADLELLTEGVVELAKAAGIAVAAGDRLYWDGTNKQLTTAAAGNRLVGVATEAAQAADAVARVLIHRLPPPAALDAALTATASLDFGSIGAGLSADLTIAVTGAAAGDAVVLGAPAALEAGLVAFAWVSAADTVSVRLVNNTAGAVDAAAGTYRVTVLKA